MYLFTSIRSYGFLLFLATLLNTNAAMSANDLASILEPGKDYRIVFNGDEKIFTTKSSGISPVETRTSDGQAKVQMSNWSATSIIKVFTVVKLGPESWIKLRHPRSPKDSIKWNMHRGTIAALQNESKVTELRQKNNGEERLIKSQELANLQFETTETWVNLAHALAIAEVTPENSNLFSTDPFPFQLKIEK